MPSPPALAATFRTARTDGSLAVLEGFHAIKHAIRFGAAFDMVAARDLAELEALATRLAPDVGAALTRMTVEVGPGVFNQLSPRPPETGVIAIAKRRAPAIAEIFRIANPAPIVLLEAPSHSGNIGAAVRVSAAAGATAVVTTGPTDPWNPGALRGSAGLHYALPVVRATAAAIEGRLLIAVDPDGDDLVPGAIPDHALLAFGSERSGLSPDLLSRAPQRLRIPMMPGISSLNLATAVAVLLYAGRRRA
ncbi:MAG: TrmH family RNA methyltransferase [Gemmatimonadales bacterium]